MVYKVFAPNSLRASLRVPLRVLLKVALVVVMVGSGFGLGLMVGPSSTAEQALAGEQDLISWYQNDNLFAQTADLQSNIDNSKSNDKITDKQQLTIKATIDKIVAMDTQFKQLAAAYPVALQASQPQLQQLIEALMLMESNTASIGIARVFYVRYVNLNPSAAVAHFWQHVPQQSSQHRRVMFNIYHEWAWMDMPTALDNIANLPVERTPEDIITFLVRDDHFTTDKALLTLAQNYSERTRSAVLMAAAQRESFDQAFERFASMEGDVNVRRQGLYRVIRRWAKEDPAAALQRVQQMSNSSDKTSLTSAVIGIWAEQDVEQALNVALNLPERGDHALSMLGSLARKDGTKALELANLYRDKLDSSVKSHIMQSWAMADPRAAATYLEGKGEKVVRKDASQIVWHYTMRHPEEAYQWAERMGLLNDRNVASNMGNALVQADLSKAEALFTTLPDGESRSGLFSHIVRKRSKMDIAQTHSWLAEHKEEANYNDARNNLLYEWTRRDPQEAAEVILSLDDNPNKTSHVHSIASNWYDKSPDIALNWVFNLPQGILRDSTIASLAQKVGRFDATEAAYIAAEIADESTLERVMKQLRAKVR